MKLSSLETMPALGEIENNVVLKRTKYRIELISTNRFPCVVALRFFRCVSVCASVRNACRDGIASIGTLLVYLQTLLKALNGNVMQIIIIIQLK